jgi:fumarate reductase subunit D
MSDTLVARARSNDARSRDHPAYWAFVVMRVSGLALALFLPAHFWALSHALTGAGGLEGFLVWTRQPLVTAGEIAIVLALAAHLTAGVRLLFVEFAGWRAETQKTMLAVAAGAALAITVLFALSV